MSEDEVVIVLIELDCVEVSVPGSDEGEDVKGDVGGGL